MTRAAGGPKRLWLVVIGAVLMLMGITWALQGAYLIPATFMRGPTWIGLGLALALVGLLLLLLGAGVRRARQSA